MATYKLPQNFFPAKVQDLKDAFILAARSAHLSDAIERREYYTIKAAIREVLYVRGMDQEIVDALLREWDHCACAQPEAGQEKEKEQAD